MSKSKIITAVAAVLIVIAILILRFQYKPADPIRADFAIEGIKNGIAIEMGQEMEGIVIAVPDEYTIGDVVSVSSDQNVGYILLDRSIVSDDNVYAAKIVGVSPGVAEVFVQSADGAKQSEKYKINVIASENAGTTTATESAETEPDGAVYITPSGTKYHLKKSCAGKNAIAKDIDYVVENGYQPCKSCARG